MIEDITENTHDILSRLMKNSPLGMIASPLTDKRLEQKLLDKMLKDFFDNLDINIERSYSIANELHTMERHEGYFALGILYCFGIHIKMDVDKGGFLLLKSSIQGYPPALYISAIVLGSAGRIKKSKDVSLALMEKLAKEGYRPAIDALEESSEGIPKGINLSYNYLCEF